ncbi:MAG: tetratricopeptide repeat protein, partial [Microcystaceae cyanobacterium]
MSLIDDSKQRADLLFQQGREKYKQERFQTAAEDFLESMALFKQLGNRLGEASSLYNLGLIRHIQGDCRQRSEFVQAVEDYKEANKFFEAALQIYREIGNRQMEANSLYRLGLVCASRNKYQLATDY